MQELAPRTLASDAFRVSLRALISCAACGVGHGNEKSRVWAGTASIGMHLWRRPSNGPAPAEGRIRHSRTPRSAPWPPSGPPQTPQGPPPAGPRGPAPWTAMRQGGLRAAAHATAPRPEEVPRGRKRHGDHKCTEQPPSSLIGVECTALACTDVPTHSCQDMKISNCKFAPSPHLLRQRPVNFCAHIALQLLVRLQQQHLALTRLCQSGARLAQARRWGRRSLRPEKGMSNWPVPMIATV